MFEDIIYDIPTPTKQPTKKINLKPRPKTPRPPKVELSAFEVVKDLDDVKMLAKILDLCKNKLRKQKRKARQQRKKRNAKLSC